MSTPEDALQGLQRAAAAGARDCAGASDDDVEPPLRAKFLAIADNYSKRFVQRAFA
jgi:hypothetical protein